MGGQLYKLYMLSAIKEIKEISLHWALSATNGYKWLQLFSPSILTNFVTLFFSARKYSLTLPCILHIFNLSNRIWVNLWIENVEKHIQVEWKPRGQFNPIQVFMNTKALWQCRKDLVNISLRQLGARSPINFQSNGTVFPKNLNIKTVLPQGSTTAN